MEPNLFPKQMNINLHYNPIYAPRKGSSKKSSMSVVYLGMNGNSINIMMRIEGNPVYVINRIPAVLAHELTHAYDGLNRTRSGTKMGLIDSLNHLYKLSVLIKQNSHEFSKIMLDFADCAYWLNPMERRANLGRLEVEIEPYCTKIVDERSATKYIESLPVYEEYKAIREKLHNIHGKGEIIRDEQFSSMEFNEDDTKSFSLSKSME